MGCGAAHFIKHAFKDLKLQVVPALATYLDTMEQCLTTVVTFLKEAGLDQETKKN